mmetsp:Transcript_3686/g.11215  ORF Transcript_3686/g.11215 Transcript_3686/m.11215 type:complete len:398 (-) Transcript_3686:1061-2254(-)
MRREEVDVGARVGAPEVLAGDVAHKVRDSGRQRRAHGLALRAVADDHDARPGLEPRAVSRLVGPRGAAERGVAEERRDGVGEKRGALFLDEARGPEDDDVVGPRVERLEAPRGVAALRVVLRHVDPSREVPNLLARHAHLRHELVSDGVVRHSDDVAPRVKRPKQPLHGDPGLEPVQQRVLGRVVAHVAVDLRVIRANRAAALLPRPPLRREPQKVRRDEVVDIGVVVDQGALLRGGQGHADDVVVSADEGEDWEGVASELGNLGHVDHWVRHRRVVRRHDEDFRVRTAVEEARDAVHRDGHPVDVFVPHRRHHGHAPPARRRGAGTGELAARRADSAAVLLEALNNSSRLVGPEHAALLISTDAPVQIRHQPSHPLVVLHAQHLLSVAPRPSSRVL